MARQQVIVECSASSHGLELRRFAVAWSDTWGYTLTPADGSGAGRRGMVTAEHVQAVLEAAGHQLEARSLDALFDLDEVVRLTASPPFLVRDPARGVVVVSLGTGRLVGDPVVRRSPAQATLRLAATVLRAVAPVGFRSLTDRRLAGDVAGDLVAFGRALQGVWHRSGIGVRELQDWATARASGDPAAVASADAALTAGQTMDPRLFSLVVSSLGRDLVATSVAGRSERPSMRAVVAVEALGR